MYMYVVHRSFMYHLISFKIKYVGHPYSVHLLETIKVHQEQVSGSLSKLDSRDWETSFPRTCLNVAPGISNPKHLHLH